MIETGGYYSIIPSYIMEIPAMHDDGTPWLNSTDKLVYGKIASLTNRTGYCWASNEAIGKGCAISSASAYRSIKKLIDSGFLARKIVRDENKRIIKRYLSLKQPQYSDDGPNNHEKSEIDKSPFEDSTPPFKSEGTPTIKNEGTPPLKYDEERLKVLDTTTKKMIHDQHPLAYYQIAFGKSATGLLNPKLTKLAAMYGNELVNYSFYLSADIGNGYQYAKAMFDAWISEGLKTIEDVDESRAKHKMLMNQKYSKGQHKDNVTPIATKEKKLNEAVYNALLNNDMDVNKTISQFKLDGINLTNEQIGAIYRERA